MIAIGRPRNILETLLEIEHLLLFLEVDSVEKIGMEGLLEDHEGLGKEMKMI